MKIKLIARLLLILVTLSFSMSNALAEKIEIDAEYFQNNMVSNCMFAFSKERNGMSKIEFKSEKNAVYSAESLGRDVGVSIKLANGGIHVTDPRINRKFQFSFENGKSYIRDQRNTQPEQVYLGSCKTKWSEARNLPSFPLTSIAAVTEQPTSSQVSVKVEKDEIAALEKKLAALKQKSARKEEYQKMRALLDQKLKEVQGQIQMLEQEYKDVLN
jgi:hypothetical protein